MGEAFDESPHATGGSVTLADLRVLAVTTDRKIDSVLAAQVAQGLVLAAHTARIEEVHHSAERLITILEEKVAKNGEEILTLRDRSHKHGNRIQVSELKLAPITATLATELAANWPTILTLVANLNKKKNRLKSWEGGWRELTFVILTLFGLIVLAPIFGELVNHFLFGKPY